MPRVKRTVTEETQVERPQTFEETQAEEAREPGIGDLWQHMEALAPADFQKIEFWIYQVDPPPSKKQGEAAYITIFKQRFTPDDLAQQFPQVARFKIWEKEVGSNRRVVWDHYQVPRAASVGTMAGSFGGLGQGTLSQGASESVIRQITDSLRQSPDLLQKAAAQGLDLQSEAFKAALSTLGKPADTLDAIIKARQAGLLPAPTDWKGLLETAKDFVVLLKEQGVFGRSPERVKYSELFEVINFVRELDSAREGKTSIWETIAPKALSTLENITGNIAQIANARRPGASASASAPPPPSSGVAQGEPAKAPQPASPPAPSALRPLTMEEANQIVQTWIAARVVEIYQEKDEKGEPIYDGETCGNWLGLTSPQLADMIEKAPGDSALEFFKGHPIIGQIAADGERGMKFLQDAIKAIKGGA